MSCADGQEEILQIYLLWSSRCYMEKTVVAFFLVLVIIKVRVKLVTGLD